MTVPFAISSREGLLTREMLLGSDPQAGGVQARERRGVTGRKAYPPIQTHHARGVACFCLLALLLFLLLLM